MKRLLKVAGVTIGIIVGIYLILVIALKIAGVCPSGSASMPTIVGGAKYKPYSESGLSLGSLLCPFTERYSY
jgi:hypothetical protein